MPMTVGAPPISAIAFMTLAKGRASLQSSEIPAGSQESSITPQPAQNCLMRSWSQGRHAVVNAISVLVAPSVQASTTILAANVSATRAAAMNTNLEWTLFGCFMLLASCRTARRSDGSSGRLSIAASLPAPGDAHQLWRQFLRIVGVEAREPRLEVLPVGVGRETGQAHELRFVRFGALLRRGDGFR